MRKFTDGLDRVTKLDGGIVAEWISAADARRITGELDEGGVGFKWERWCGDRTAWNGVSAYWPATNARGVETNDGVMDSRD